MAWWAVLYLLIYISLSFFSMNESLQRKKEYWRLIAGTLSSLAGIIMIFAYFYPKLSEQITLLALIGILGYALLWDTYSLYYEAEHFEEDYKELIEEEGIEDPESLTLYGIFFSGLLILPTYLAGLLAISRLFKS